MSLITDEVDLVACAQSHISRVLHGQDAAITTEDAASLSDLRWQYLVVLSAEATDPGQTFPSSAAVWANFVAELQRLGLCGF